MLLISYSSNGLLALSTYLSIVLSAFLFVNFRFILFFRRIPLISFDSFSKTPSLLCFSLASDALSAVKILVEEFEALPDPDGAFLMNTLVTNAVPEPFIF